MSRREINPKQMPIKFRGRTTKLSMEIATEATARRLVCRLWLPVRGAGCGGAEAAAGIFDAGDEGGGDGAKAGKEDAEAAAGWLDLSG